MKKILILKSKGIKLGVELVTNGTFDTDTVWSKTNDTSISGGKGIVDGTSTSSLLFQDILTDNLTYRVTFDVSGHNATGDTSVIDNSGATLYSIDSNGSKSFDFTHDNASGNFIFKADSGGYYEVDNVSVKQVVKYSSKDLGSELFDTGIISNNAGGVAVYTDTGIDAESDGTAINLRPRILYNNLTIGSSYRIVISNASFTGETNVIKLFDGNKYLLGTSSGSGDPVQDYDISFVALGTNVFIAFDGREIFTADFDLSLKEIL